MDSLFAFAMGQIHKNDRSKVFDWIKAARLIRLRLPKVASAGLAGDWEYTSGEIYRDGAPIPADETYTYLSSNWALPELDIDGEVIDCWVWRDETTWDAHTYWPPEALEELRSS